MTKTSSATASLSRILQNTAFYRADIPIIVCNPLTTPLSTVLSAQLPVNTIFVITSTIPQTDLCAIIQQYLCSVPSSRLLQKKPPQIISADPKRAVDAILTIQGQYSSLSAVQKFQDDFLGSNISEVARALQRKLTGKQPFTLVRKNMAICHINNALQWSSANVLHLRNELDQAFIDVSAFKERIEETQAKAENQIFGRYDRDAGKKPEPNAVAEAIREAEVELKDVVDRLSWWRMMWRVDEISTIVGTAVKGAWCHDLEKKVNFVICILTTKLTVVLANSVYR